MGNILNKPSTTRAAAKPRLNTKLLSTVLKYYTNFCREKRSVTVRPPHPSLTIFLRKKILKDGFKCLFALKTPVFLKRITPQKVIVL